MPHAKAEISGRVVAETDNYEVVEGNIYVSQPTFTYLSLLLDGSY